MVEPMRAALLSLLILSGGMAVAQDNTAPVVPDAAPEQSAAPVTEGSEAPPVVPDAAPDAPLAPVTEETGAITTPDTGAASPAVTPATGAETTTTPAADPATPAATGEAVQPAAGPAEAASAPAAALPVHSVELESLFWDAHVIVQAVMVGLAIAAFVALVILIHKLFEFGFAFASMRKTARLLASASSLHAVAEAVAGRKGPSVDMIRAADEELRLAEAEPALIPGTRDRTDTAMSRIEAGAAARLRSGTGILASIGSLSPFVGLFGTVFGIMNSFLAIAQSNTTNLAVVAPGIAEALLATAIGLAAAIPAVLIYNVLSRKLAKYRLQLNDVAAAAARLQSRSLDRLSARV
ncbi:tonB-system energizer ExbB [Rhodobacter sp. 24-YEA-8]|uniref:tonB-system energizer ExbB n=1 Tax=Rhodobacter sp. 24-YEA-8 TaxID=1884310 RepID=UPI001495EE97|nr:tonB-system energizer ExbB [Rhodobacter sp. 24-YEA-8]